MKLPPKTPTEIDAYLRSMPPHRILKRECKHATYSVHEEEYQSDALTIKEWVTLDDGTRWPTVRVRENYQRPFWLTKKAFRTHPEKIQFEHANRVEKFKSPQIKMRQEIVSQLGYGTPTNPMRQIARSPYVYGTDPGAEVFLKQSYIDHWPDAFVPNNVTVIDAETDVNGVIDGKKQLPILWSEVNDNEVIVYVNEQWTFDIPNYVELLKADYAEIIPQWVDGLRKGIMNKKGEYPQWVDDILKMEFKVIALPTHFHITEAMMNHLHETQPDIVTGWNVFFDAGVIALSTEYAGHNIADMFSDKRVPKALRYVYLKKGPETRLTSSGKSFRLDPQEQWHVITSTSSFRFLDSMQIYWQLRKAKGKESGGYGLGAVLDRQLKIGKLSFETEDSSIPPGSLHWHMDMQHRYKVRYGSYNAVDSIGVWVLNKKNDDLSSQISMLAGATDYSNFNSQPKVNSTDMLLDRKSVV